MIEHGAVIWYSQRKGYGFIKREGERGELFVHWTALKLNGLQGLESGQIVEFTVAQSARGPRAENVAVVRTPES